MSKSQFLLLLGWCLILGALYRNRFRVRASLTAFLEEKASPLNLGVFRLLVFVILARSTVPHAFLWFSGLPADLRFSPPGLDAFTPYTFPTTGAAQTIAALFSGVCVLGAIGLFTRVSVVAALILSLYVLGLPQFFGKVDHYHHLIWFLILLSFSPCGDALSIDALIRAVRCGDPDSAVPNASRVYAFPIRLAWLCMGLIYFFPGFWKLWNCGPHWFLAENMKYQLYAKWIEFGDWTPAFRLDQYPGMLMVSGLGTILLETSWIFLIIRRRTRPIAAIGGLAFHNLTNFFMRIPFFELQAFYLTLLDWDRLLREAGKRLFRFPLEVVYDGNCFRCRQTIAALETLNILGSVRFSGNPSGTLNDRSFGHRMEEASRWRAIHATEGTRIFRGYMAYRQIAVRCPAFWPILPLLYVPWIEKMASQFDNRAACHPWQVGHRPDQKRRITTERTVGEWLPLAAVFLLTANILCGIYRIDSWPFACYPRFDYLAEKSASVLVLTTDRGAEHHVYDPIRNPGGFAAWPHRLNAMMGRILNEPDPLRKERRLVAFWRVVAGASPQEPVPRLRAYRERISVLPGSHPTLTRELVYDSGSSVSWQPGH